MNKKFKSIFASSLAILSISGVSTLPVGAMQTPLGAMQTPLGAAQLSMEEFSMYVSSLEEIQKCDAEILDLDKTLKCNEELVASQRDILKLGRSINIFLNRIMGNDELKIDINGFRSLLNKIIRARTFKEVYITVSQTRGNMDENFNGINLNSEDVNISKEVREKIVRLAKKALISYLIDGLVVLRDLAKNSVEKNPEIMQIDYCVRFDKMPRDRVIEVCNHEGLQKFYRTFISFTRSNPRLAPKLVKGVNKLCDVERFCHGVQTLIHSNAASIFSYTKRSDIQSTELYKRVSDLSAITHFLFYVISNNLIY